MGLEMEDVYRGPMLWLDRFDDSLDEMVLYAFGAVGAVCLVLAIILLILGCVLKTSNTPGSSLNFYVAIGSLLLVACVIIQGLDPEYVAEAPRKDLCQVYPTMLCFGLILVTGALLIRCLHIFNFHRKNAKKVQKEEWKANLLMFLLLLVEAAPLLVWIVLYGIKGTDGADTQCTSNEYVWFKVGMAAYHGLIILLGAILVWPALFYSKKTPTEIDATVMSVICFNNLFAAAAGACIYFFYDTTPTIMYAIGGGLILYVVFMTVALLVAAKLCVARKMSSGDGEYYSKMNGTSSPTSANTSRANDDLYVNESPAQSNIAETFSY